ncbi:MAG TPA: molybdenum cofactor guanylyltransferase [Fimbriimonadaceae bacterium]|nr:molybdenum cofactor guanylyltransferase [Fimbriimonadaceae bacterium]
MNEVEAVILTGGASRRMGKDKAKLVVAGEPLAARIAGLIATQGVPVTVAGREPIASHAFLEDGESFAGPLSALATFQPKAEFVFVASCDLPGFDPRLIAMLANGIGAHQAAVPMAGGRAQPLCALYRASAFAEAARLAAVGERRVMAWLACLDWTPVEDIEPAWLANVNTPDDLREFPVS